ncbi:phosphatase PAP2 family protein [Frankia sp. Mgl5]|uniref:phosphatase PAP2 family protein n=1 Tax=Frankia sp. Mgl5 TaxID=2933793 RepID=UPI00200FD062|nr:phosphatase PAP2 family protein [Frankia sp. Mgl5]MCK9929792.1 phosphatase PAP2 family protein [Frankia sp. Mgl5]
MVSILFPVPDRATSASPNAALPPRDSWWHRSRIGRLASTLLFLASQVLLLDLLYMLYRMGRHLAVGREAQALTNAQDVWNLERLLNLPNESAIQQLALHSSHLLELANRFYVGVHFPASTTFLLWVLIRHRKAWPRVRTVILASTGAALVIHILYPLAPPRFLPQALPHVTFVDTGTVFGPSAYTAGDTVANQYAAMPSLHVGWSILVAWGVVAILRSRARWLIILHPLITITVVVITANHYWLDGLIGGALVVTAVQLTRPEVQARIRLWRISVGEHLCGRSHGLDSMAASTPPWADDLDGAWRSDPWTTDVRTQENRGAAASTAVADAGSAVGDAATDPAAQLALPPARTGRPSP